jgi:hypothetical protein
MRWRRRDQPRNRKRCDALAATTLTDEANRFTFIDAERHSIDGAEWLFPGAELDLEIFDFEQRHLEMTNDE